MLEMNIVYSWIVNNKEIVKIFYGLIVSVICAIIVSKSNKLFQLSYHQGIRYFRNAFFFYGIAFFIRYIIAWFLIFVFLNDTLLDDLALKFLFEFFLIMAGFFLLYSLIWKKIEPIKNEHSFSSLVNLRILVFYAMAIIIVILDYIWNTYAFLFLSQILLFCLMSIMSYINYKEKSQNKFPKFYFIAMMLSFVAWLLNLFVALWLEWNKIVLINIYILNIIVFLIFLYGVFKCY